MFRQHRSTSRHPLPALAACAALLLAGASQAEASRSCLDRADTTPPLLLAQDRAGCWVHDRQLPRADLPGAIRESISFTEEPETADGGPLVLLNEERLETGMTQLVMAVWMVLAATGLLAARPDVRNDRRQVPAGNSW